MSTIPANAIVDVNPNVLAAGGSGLDLIGLILSTNTRVPIGGVQAFSTAAAVASFFGPTTSEAAAAAVYFGGFEGATVTPGSVLFAQYPTTAVAAFMRGGNVSALTLSQLQALSGTLSITIDAVVNTGSPNLSAATSFSNAAFIIADALGIDGAQVAAFTGAIAGTTLTVSAIASGALIPGVVLNGSGVVAGTYITALGTGTGGVGTYTVSDTQTVASEAMTADAPAVQYDSVSGAFVVASETTGPSSTIGFATGTLASSLKLTSATGAVISQGAAIATPAAFMTSIAALTQNWATFMLLFDPDAGSGHVLKLAFAAWTSAQNDRYAFVCWDTDASPTNTVPATASLGYALQQADYSGTFLVYETSDLQHAAFVCGACASIDYAQTDGRTTLAFRRQNGLATDVDDQTVGDNLIANGYNFYGAYATANDLFNFLYPGSVSGPYQWMDSYINQIQLSNAFQLALVTLLTSVGSVPYNAAGRAKIEATLNDPINAALNFGTIRAGVTLSASQASAVNAAAGVQVSGVLQTRGWYLQVLDAAPSVRQARGTPPCNFWYTDGQSVQKIDLASVLLT